MSLTRFLPTPSDRMGILWNLLTIEGSVVLEYGPAGTTHFSMGLFGEMDIDQQNRLFTTHMREADVVMGDVSRLEDAILEIDENYQPEVLFVVASSAAAVIGVDLKGVCTYMQPRVKARLIAFEEGGFRGDYGVGLQAVYRLLAENLTRRAEKREVDTFNIIGASLWSYRIRSDVNELCRLLEEGFGLRMNACLCMETSVEQIRRMGEASLNLVIHSAAIPAARSLEHNLGTPCICGLPYGYGQTLEWLRSIGAVLDRPLNPKLERELMEKRQMSMQYQMYKRMLKCDTMKAVLYGEYDTVKGMAEFLHSIGMDISHRLCAHSIACIEEPCGDIVCAKTEKERIDIMKSLRKTFVLADDTMLKLCSGDNTRLRIALPVIDGMVLARHLPLAGERGADFILEYVEQYLQTLH